MINKIFLFLLFIFSFNSYCLWGQGLKTISEAIQYINTHPEFPPIDNDDIYNPTYTSFHKSIKPGFIKRNLARWGIISPPAWSSDDMGQSLRKAITQRELNGFIGNFIWAMHAQPDHQVILIGNIQGALHSLVNILKYFQNKSVITDDLKVIDPQYSFIIFGVTLNRSPYILETLTLILNFLAANPIQVIYLKSEDEYENSWKSFGIKRELLERAKAFGESELPYERDLKRFFNTLPLGAYIYWGNNPQELLRISSFERTREILNEKQFGKFYPFNQPPSSLFHKYKLGKNPKEITTDPPHVKVSLKALDPLETSMVVKGLDVLPPEENATVWNIFSSPTSSYQRCCNYHYDSFAAIKLADTLEDTTISLFTQDVRQRTGFRKEQTFNIFTGAPIMSSTAADVYTIGRYAQILKKEK